MKKCFKCGVEKSLDQFYTHRGMADGHLNKCIQCAKKDVSERFQLLKDNPSFIEAERVRGREKYHRLNYRVICKPTTDQKQSAMKTYLSKYPEKRKAHLGCQHIPRSLPDMEFHHWSYNEVHIKDVIELSISDHNLLHRHLKYDTENKMFRRRDSGELLNTKEKHMEFMFQTILNHVLS